MKNISSFDYSALLSYKNCLMNNQARLEAVDLGHEMFNTAAMGIIVCKMPIQESVDWKKVSC